VHTNMEQAIHKRELIIPCERQRHSRISEQHITSKKTEDDSFPNGLVRLGEFRDYRIDLTLGESIEGYRLTSQEDFGKDLSGEVGRPHYG
jgi:hypothetical protein